MNELVETVVSMAAEESERPKRTRRFKKRVRFQPPKPIVPVKALWESASEEERTKAHKTCTLMIEYWLGRKSKAEMVAILGLPPLRVWQLSQSALSGMLAGLLKQPKARKRGAEAMSATSELSELRKEIARLKKENQELKIVNELLKDLPLNRQSASSSESKDPARGKKAQRPKTRESGASDSRPATL
jgi:hypothetical protein